MLPFRTPWYAISQDIMRSLHIEGLLDFRVRREKKVDQDDGGDEQGEKRICSFCQLDVLLLTGHTERLDTYLRDAALRPILNALSLIIRALLSESIRPRAPQVLASHQTPVSPTRLRFILRKVPKKYTRAINIRLSCLILSPSIGMMLFGLGNLFYGKSVARFGELELSLMFPQYRSSSSTLLPYYQRIDFLREVSLSFALTGLGSGLANQLKLDGATHPRNHPLGDPMMPRA